MAEGAKLVEEAMAAGVWPERLFVESGGVGAHDLARRAGAGGCDVLEVEKGVLGRVLATVSPQPVAAVVPLVHVPLATIEASGPIVVCAGVADPGNAGTIVRSAAASGGGAVVFCAGAVDVYNPKVVRATAGAVFRIPVVCGDPARGVLDDLRRTGRRRVGAEAHGGRDHTGADLASPLALVLGSESHGVDPGLAGLLDEVVTVPLAAGTESLNVAMAATVLLFEAARQRRAAAAATPG